MVGCEAGCALGERVEEDVEDVGDDDLEQIVAVGPDDVGEVGDGVGLVVKGGRCSG